CSQCNRVRLTAQGQLKPCLYYDAGTDLRALLRAGEDDNALRNAIAQAIRSKPASHQFGSTPASGSEGRYMNQIGG
ncbi:MAG: GTP 3',8-cyclase MoaA, partial [Lawsonibacter sp.]